MQRESQYNLNLQLSIYTLIFYYTSITLFNYNLSLTAAGYDCALSNGTATKCSPTSCIIDTNVTLVADVTFCCDPVIVNQGDTLEILGATGTVNGNC